MDHPILLYCSSCFWKVGVRRQGECWGSFAFSFAPWTLIQANTSQLRSVSSVLATSLQDQAKRCLAPKREASVPSVMSSPSPFNAFSASYKALNIASHKEAAPAVWSIWLTSSAQVHTILLVVYCIQYCKCSCTIGLHRSVYIGLY